MPLTISPKEIGDIVNSNEAALQRAIYKWIRFQQAMWMQIRDSQEEKVKNLYASFSVAFRVVIITMSSAITTMSDISAISRVVITILAGTLTAITGIEAYFKFSERSLSIKQKQREIQSLRDELRYRWMKGVELETDFAKRMECAKELLEHGPKAYNNILDKYIFKKKEAEEKPEAT